MMIAVVDYHKGNLKSVERGLAAAGCEPRVTDDAAAIERADAVVLPGVGAFADAADAMRRLGQLDAVRRRIEAGAPFLGICLGMHLMFEEGVEGAPDRAACGMGIFPGQVRAMPKADAAGRAYKVPHVGWNAVELEPGGSSPLFEGIDSGACFYFTHGFIAPTGPYVIARSEHSVSFPSAVRFGDAAFGVQFHPEKSSDAGLRFLSNFVSLVKEA